MYHVLYCRRNVIDQTPLSPFLLYRPKIRRFWLEGRQLRSNFGTTKYCATYLRNSPCANPECLYLHELGSEEDRFSKEEIQQRSLLAPPIPSGAVTVTGAGGPSGTGKRCTSPFLPPPVYESLENSGSSGAGGGGGGSTITMRGLPQQVQQTSAAAHRGVGRGAKPAGQVCCSIEERRFELLGREVG